MDATPREDQFPLTWARPYMRSLRAGFAKDGIERCPMCQRDGRGIRPTDVLSPGAGRPASFADYDASQDDPTTRCWPAGSRPHPLSWMSIQPHPALIWHGEPQRGELKMFISTYCNFCYVVTLFDSGGTWSEDHPDLTRLSDEEQDAADPDYR